MGREPGVPSILAASEGLVSPGPVPAQGGDCAEFQPVGVELLIPGPSGVSMGVLCLLMQGDGSAFPLALRNY